MLGVPSILTQPSGFLSGPSGDAPGQIARNFLDAHKDLFGLTAADLSEITITDSYTSSASGLAHIYLQQRLNGIGVYNGVANISISPAGQVLVVGNSLVPELASSLNTLAPVLGASQAAARAAQDLGLTSTGPFIVLSEIGRAHV